MKSDKNYPNQTPHAPGSGSDRQHPETPPDANERAKADKQKIEDKEKNSDKQKR